LPQFGVEVIDGSQLERDLLPGEVPPSGVALDAGFPLVHDGHRFFKSPITTARTPATILSSASPDSKRDSLSPSYRSMSELIDSDSSGRSNLGRDQTLKRLTRREIRVAQRGSQGKHGSESRHRGGVHPVDCAQAGELDAHRARHAHGDEGLEERLDGSLGCTLPECLGPDHVSFLSLSDSTSYPAPRPSMRYRISRVPSSLLTAVTVSSAPCS